jgi:prolyl 4-hydroxylase
MELPPQIAQAFALVAAGRATEAVRLLERLAMTGDGAARYQLAEWRREGEIVPRDFAMARDLYRLAGQAGIIEGIRRLYRLLAAGAGGPRDWAAEPGHSWRALPGIDRPPRGQLSLVRGMRLTDMGDPVAVPSGETIGESPRIVRFNECLSAAECAWLAQAAEPMFEPAPTVDERTGRLIMNPVRTSDTAVFPWVAENPAVHALNRRIAAASATRAEQGEPLQVLRYAPGQEYRPHIDAVPGLANQRILTMLVWLNDDYEGGETRFIETGLTVKGNKGDALLFENVDAEGRPDTRMVHAGLPVTAGVKLLASRWIRANPVTE